MLFAKDDMDGAAIALAENDLLEAEDAGSFVADSLNRSVIAPPAVAVVVVVVIFVFADSLVVLSVVPCVGSVVRCP